MYSPVSKSTKYAANHWITPNPKESSHAVEQLLGQENLNDFNNFASKFFHFYSTFVCNLHLVPLSISSKKGKLEHARSHKLIIHYVVLFLLATSMVHKMVAFSYQLAAADPLDSLTLMCVVTLSCYIVSLSLSYVTLSQPNEVIDLINGLAEILASCTRQDGHVTRIIANTKTAAFTVSLAFLGAAVPLALSSFSHIRFSTLLVLSCGRSYRTASMG